MNIVPLVPITMVRPPGCPDDQTSALKPGGSLILSSGSLSTGVTVGGVGCGLRLSVCLLAAGFDLSIGLNPGGDCAPAGNAAAARTAIAPAMSRPCRHVIKLDI